MIEPRYTLQSVLLELVEGLESGEIVVVPSSEHTDQPAIEKVAKSAGERSQSKPG
jgi:hypothetical protein